MAVNYPPKVVPANRTVNDEMPSTIWEAAAELRNVQRASLGVLGIQFEVDEAVDTGDYPLDAFLNEVLARLHHEIQTARTICNAIQRAYEKVRP